MTWAEALAPLRAAAFRWYFASRVANTLGTTMATVALTFAVLDLTGSASAVGQVLAARTVPMVLLLLYGGVLADRLPRSLVLQLSNSLSALTQGTVAFLVLTGSAELWMILLLEAANGAVSAVSMPAMQAIVPSLVPRASLQQANALLSLSRNGLAVLGPSIGAGLVVTVGAGWAIAVDACLWLVAALLLLPVDLPPLPRTEERPGFVAELREGWTVFAGTTWLWVVVVAFAVINAVHIGAFYTLGPAVADRTIGKDGWGLVLSAEALGFLLMTVLLLRVRLRRPLLLGMVGVALLGAPLAVLGTGPDLGLLLGCALVAGAGTELFALAWTLAMQENIEPQLLSRAYSYDALGSYAAMPVGQLLYGPLGETFGHQDVLLASSFVIATAALAPLLSRSVRTLDRVPIDPAPSPVSP
ncbi:MFS transporter [Nocardioides caldifontis]|uniref:MFS transporter n=1 Tax=Nocardioides caldifontis TaxID=2588938 RepID=UPI0011DF1858|nr:MFS transporter [Nocardioides caldifontis]